MFGSLPDAFARLRRNSRLVVDEFCTGDPFFTVDPDLKVLTWNLAVEGFTGVTASEVVGRPCWEVLGGLGEAGDLMCQAGCSNARLAREGFPVPSHVLSLRTERGRAHAYVSTLAFGDGRLAHVLIPKIRPRSVAAVLTPRQREVLELMAKGLQAKAIAERLRVTNTTVRTHIRAILRELGAHSQLEALAKARDSGLLRT
jgi:DNA-binding CsgD family transcriptional regulator